MKSLLTAYTLSKNANFWVTLAPPPPLKKFFFFYTPKKKFFSAPPPPPQKKKKKKNGTPPPPQKKYNTKTRYSVRIAPINDALVRLAGCKADENKP